MFDYKNFDLREEIEKLKKISGKERGQDIHYLIRYAKLIKGEDGHRRVEAELNKCGCKLPDVSQIHNMDWIPASLPSIYMVAMVKVFGWGYEDLVKMGKELSKFSATIRIFIRYFISPQKTFDQMCKNWHKYFDFGQTTNEYDEKNKRLIIKLEGFAKHPVFCAYFLGVLTNLAEMTLGKPVRGKETKCVFKGDAYHLFEFTWE